MFDVEAGGGLGNGRVFASNIFSATEPGVPDGMKCDALGNVWLSAPGGIWVYAPDGRLIGKLRIPELVSNLTWGGPDWRTLYITATHSVYAVPVKVGPRNEPYMRGGQNAPAAAQPAPAAVATVSRSGARLAEPGYAVDPKRCALLSGPTRRGDGRGASPRPAPGACRDRTHRQREAARGNRVPGRQVITSGRGRARRAGRAQRAAVRG